MPLVETGRRNEFVALVAHELRNPLSAVAMSTQIIKRACVPVPAVRQAIDAIERQVAILTRLVDDLTDVSRLVTDKIVLHPQPIHMSEICEQAVETVQTQIDAKHHNLKVTAENVDIIGDPVRIQQVIANVLSNAVKFTPKGGEIELHIVGVNQGVAVVVKDNGCGLHDDAIPRAFEMFFQEESCGGNGLGIGLTLAQKLVHMHGGDIGLESGGRNLGCKVTITLPEMPKPQAKSQMRVLIIDDNADHADSLATLLGMEDFQVRVAYSGPDGLKKIASFSPDVVFLDIGMPIMDGYEVMSRITKVAERPHVVALTGFGQHSDKERTHAAGFDGHVIKPPLTKDLIKIVNAVAAQR